MRRKSATESPFMVGQGLSSPSGSAGGRADSEENLHRS
jgi:hypothetical protein